MHNYILGAAIFFFAASIALNVYSVSMLNRAIDVLHFSLNLLERTHSDNHSDIYRKEGSI